MERMGESKVDFKKTIGAYAPGRNHVIRIVDVAPMQYLMVDGQGDPNTSTEFADAIVLLYPVAYKLKFASKAELGRDYVVMPLEGLWWSDDMETFTSARDKSQWNWTLMIMVPDWVTPAMFSRVLAGLPPEHQRVRLETLSEGLSAQTLHVGSFDDEAEILKELHDVFVPESGHRMTGRHHEIYFSDLRKVTPDKFRTILRQPIEPIEPIGA
jgi:hypothetical protein